MNKICQFIISTNVLSVAFLLNITTNVDALEYKDTSLSIPLGEAAAAEYKSSLGSVVIQSKNSKGDIIHSRCIASVRDSKWIALASHCVVSESISFVKGMFVLGNDPKKSYNIDLVVAPKNRTRLQGDGSDRGANSKTVVNDYSMVRLSSDMDDIKPISFCADNTPTTPYLAKAQFFGANNVEYDSLETTTKPLLMGESIAYVTPYQTITHTEFGDKDEFTALWNTKNQEPFSSDIESNIQKGDSGSIVMLKDKKCQIAVVSYIGKYNYANPLTGKDSQINANFSSTIQPDDVEWIEKVQNTFSDNNYLETLGVIPLINAVPIVEY